MTSFAAKPYYQKMAILFGGIFVNIAFAFIALTLLFSYHGIPALGLFASKTSVPEISEVLPGSPAEQAGLKPGDRIAAINERAIDPATPSTKVVHQLHEFAGSSVQLMIQRGESTETLTANLNPTGSKFILGALFVTKALPPLPTLKDSANEAFHHISGWISETFRSLGAMFKCRTTAGLGGPIAIMHGITASLNTSIIAFIVMLAYISVGIACLNVIPLPIFDGGQALVYTIEAATGISMDRFREIIHYISWIAMLSLLLFLSWKDIMQLIFKS